MVDQLCSFADEGHASRRSRNRRESSARTEPRRARSRGNMEGSHRQRERDGVEPHEPDPKHRGCYDRCCKGRPGEKITVDVRARSPSSSRRSTRWWTRSGFAGEVTRVAREVGTEGRLGGQAQVPGVAGTWKDLTDNVNFLASNLTGQVRNIADVTTAVARRSLAQDDRRREGRDPGAQEHDQHDGRSAQRICVEVTRVARKIEMKEGWEDRRTWL